MNVDTMVFGEFKEKLQRCARSLDEASNTLLQNVRRAGASLEGKQYSLSVQETNASCKIIDTSVENLSELKKYIEKLEEYVNEYLSCKYEG